MTIANEGTSKGDKFKEQGLTFKDESYKTTKPGSENTRSDYVDGIPTKSGTGNTGEVAK